MANFDSPVDDIKSRLDIVEVIQEYLRLTKAGTSYRGLCPFHSEKTPSFFVSPDRQIWHCFGCGEGGDIFSFVMKMEGIDFAEVLRNLAKKANVVLKREDPAIQSQKTSLLDIISLAAKFFQKVLLETPQGAKTREYLKQRGISEETISEFKIGYSPDQWEVLNKFLVQRGIPENDIFLAGLTVKKERGVGFYDRFRGRLMFPIADHQGNLVGFGARTLKTDEEAGAKYINSPQTMIYDKGRLLFGLDKAKLKIRKDNMAIMVEGYFDVIASHQAGVTNVVASSGTALTPVQIKLLKRYTKNLVLAYDPDLAGDLAAARGIEIAWAEGMNVKVMRLPRGKDPDQLIKENPERWLKAISEAQSIVDYYFATTLEKLDLSKVEDKKTAAEFLLPIIARLPDSIEQTHYLQKLSKEIKVEEIILREKIGLNKNRAAKATKMARGKKAGLVSSAPAKERHLLLGELLLSLLFKFPETIDKVIDHFKPEFLTDEPLADLYKKLIIYYTECQHFDYGEFVKSLAKEDKKIADRAEILFLQAEKEWTNLDEDEEAVEKELRDILNSLKRNYLNLQLKELEAKINEAEEENDLERIKKYSERFNELANEIIKLSQNN